MSDITNSTMPLLLLIACTLFFLPQAAWAQKDLVVLFQDDFEDGLADDWELDPGWQIDTEPNGNHALSGTGHSWAVVFIDGGMHCIIEARIKLLTEDGFHLNFRMSDNGIFTRYLLGLLENRLYLSKQTGPEFLDLYGSEVPLDRGSWHTVKIVLEAASIKVYLDDIMRVNFVDEDKPFLFGRFAFEILRFEAPIAGFGIPPLDINKDMIVNFEDAIILAQHFGEDATVTSDPNPDVNGDGTVNILDPILVCVHFGEVYPEVEEIFDLAAKGGHSLTFFEVGPDGTLYVPAGGELLIRYPDGEVETMAYGFANIRDAKFAPDGSLYVTDYGVSGLYRLVPRTTGEQ